MSKQVVEKLYETQVGPYYVRIWFKSHIGAPIKVEDKPLEFHLHELYRDIPSINDLAMRLSLMENVSAIQIKNGKQSVIVYNDWP